jgi:rhodanese-related sulfurtransferase
LIVRALARQVAALLCLALLPAIAQALYLRGKVSWQTPVAASQMIGVREAIALGDGALWLDARPDAEFEHEHVPGAIQLNEDRFNELLPQMLQVWSPQRKVVVYCSSQACGASREVARRLRNEAGLTNVFVLEGGWEAWLATRT